MSIHFISGLPRSGSTLLAALLRQNPAFHASMSSPVGAIFSAMLRAVSRGNEAAMLLTDGQRERLLVGTFDAVYGFPKSNNDQVIFDTNRMWPSKLPTLVKLFPDCRIICCVRSIPWIMDSIERLVQKNPLEISGIFGFDPGGTVYSRCAALATSNGLVGFARDALNEGLLGPYRDRLLPVEYEALVKAPIGTLKAIYEWLKLEWYEGHDPNNVEQIPLAAEFDEKLGTPGLHSVRSKVGWEPRATVLPQPLFESFNQTLFWRVVPTLSFHPLEGKQDGNTGLNDQRPSGRYNDSASGPQSGNSDCPTAGLTKATSRLERTNSRGNAKRRRPARGTPAAPTN